MKTITLPPRLAAAAALVPSGARLADIGTDHGYLPVFLLQSGAVSSAYASDVRPEPLARAVRAAARAGVAEKIRFDLADGLSGLRPGEADCVVIAGMGGETIAKILAASAGAVAPETAVILQPMSKPERLRETLYQLDFAIRGERLALDGGVIYPILLCGLEPESAGPPPRGGCSRAELLTGRWELISAEPLFPAFLNGQIERLQRALAGLRACAKPQDSARLPGLLETLDGLLEMQRRLCHANSA